MATMNKLPAAVAIGKHSAQKRFAGKTPQEIANIMSIVRKKGIERKKKNEEQTTP